MDDCIHKATLFLRLTGMRRSVLDAFEVRDSERRCEWSVG